MGDGSTDRGTTNIQTVTVDEVDHRIMDIGTTESQIIKFGSSNAAGTFADDTVQHLRITNLGPTNYITLRIQLSDAEYFVKLHVEDHFILGNSKMEAHEDGDSGINVSATFANIDSIWAKANSAAVQLEYFIASVS
tara:strand:- start:258 stop:665 length:408 start_codon:yes stop_codon:yes gene_type:complete